jgi:hypothetical protein
MELKAYYKKIIVKEVNYGVILHIGLIRQNVTRVVDTNREDYYIPVSKQHIVIGDNLELKYKIVSRYNVGRIRMVSAFQKLALATPNATA